MSWPSFELNWTKSGYSTSADPTTMIRCSNRWEQARKRSDHDTDRQCIRRCDTARHIDNAAQRPALQLPLRRATRSVKIARISRAEGGQLQAPVGRHRIVGNQLCRCLNSYSVAV